MKLFQALSLISAHPRHRDHLDSRHAAQMLRDLIPRLRRLPRSVTAVSVNTRSAEKPIG